MCVCVCVCVKLPTLNLFLCEFVLLPDKFFFLSSYTCVFGYTVGYTVKSQMTTAKLAFILHLFLTVEISNLSNNLVEGIRIMRHLARGSEGATLCPLNAK